MSANHYLNLSNQIFAFGERLRSLSEVELILVFQVLLIFVVIGSIMLRLWDLRLLRHEDRSLLEKLGFMFAAMMFWPFLVIGFGVVNLIEHLQNRQTSNGEPNLNQLESGRTLSFDWPEPNNEQDLNKTSIENTCYQPQMNTEPAKSLNSKDLIPTREGNDDKSTINEAIDESLTILDENETNESFNGLDTFLHSAEVHSELTENAQKPDSREGKNSQKIDVNNDENNALPGGKNDSFGEMNTSNEIEDPSYAKNIPIRDRSSFSSFSSNTTKSEKCDDDSYLQNSKKMKLDEKLDFVENSEGSQCENSQDCLNKENKNEKVEQPQVEKCKSTVEFKKKEEVKKVENPESLSELPPMSMLSSPPLNE